VEEFFPIVMLLIFIQGIAMWNSEKRLKEIELTVAGEVAQQQRDSANLQVFETSVTVALQASVDRSLAAKEERRAQYAEMIRIMTEKATESIADVHTQVGTILDKIDAVQKIRKQEYNELYNTLLKRTDQRVTRNELNVWTRELQKLFPTVTVPEMPQIDAPKDVGPAWYPPMLPK
jgi:cyclophilin family peptidyl-prolyl cis-trans isomerase